MFDQTFVGRTQKIKGPFPFAFSVLLETSLLALMLLIPLIYTQALPSAALKSILTVPPAPPTAPKSIVQMKSQHALITHRLFELIAPRVIPNRINSSAQELPAAPDVAIPGTVSGGTAADGLMPSVSKEFKDGFSKRWLGVSLRSQLLVRTRKHIARH